MTQVLVIGATGRVSALPCASAFLRPALTRPTDNAPTTTRRSSGMSFPTTPAPDNQTNADHGFVLGPDDGDAYHWLGSLTLNKVTRAHTRGDVDIVDHRVPPAYAPPVHVHRDQDEVFFIIEGELDVTCGTDAWHAGPGSLVFLPRGVAHGFAVTGTTGARTLLINAPAGFADVISELGSPANGLTLPGSDAPMPDPQRIGEVSRAHGIFPPDA
jgi:mannose-6-phosphate isomerase-like protein (cupin superfamily)